MTQKKSNSNSIIKRPSDLHVVSGPNYVDVQKHKEYLLELDNEIISSTKHTFPFKDVTELADFFLVEHQSITNLWVDKKGVVVGYFSYIEKPDKEGRVELLNIGVLPTFLRRGYAQEMMKYYFNLMRKRGYKKSKLVTDPKNTPARKLYEKLGYIYTDLLKDYYGPGRDRILYIKEL